MTTSEHIYTAADELRRANARTDTGALSNPETAARVIVVAFLKSAKAGGFASMKNAAIVIDALIEDAMRGTPAERS